MEHNFFCSFNHNDLSILKNEKIMKTIYTQTKKDIIKSLKNNKMIDFFVNDEEDFITKDEYMFKRALLLFPELKEDITFFKKCVAINSFTLEHAGNKVKDNKDVVMKAITEDEYAIEYASDRLQNNFEVVFAAASKSENVLSIICPNSKIISKLREHGIAASKRLA